MEYNLEEDLENLVKQATWFKENLKIPEYQFVKGKISGMFLSYMSFDLLEEANLCNDVLGKYPFVGNVKVDMKKLFNISEEKNE